LPLKIKPIAATLFIQGFFVKFMKIHNTYNPRRINTFKLRGLSGTSRDFEHARSRPGRTSRYAQECHWRGHPENKSGGPAGPGGRLPLFLSGLDIFDSAGSRLGSGITNYGASEIEKIKGKCRKFNW
jgi:hypothetical protein